MPAESRPGTAVGVDRLQPGDHAYLGFTDDEARWDVLAVFTQQGFARDEKVFLLVDVVHSVTDAAMRVTGSWAEARTAVRSGRLVVSNSPRFPRGGFDARRLVEGARRRIGTVIAEGYTGLRSASEMSLALAPVDTLDQAVRYETALHAAFFSGRPSRRYTALCYWDERVFGRTAALEAVRAIHPVTLLSTLGALRVSVTGAGVKLTGDSDLANRPEFEAALLELASQPHATLVRDITDLSFLDAHCAGVVLRLAAALGPGRRLEVRCRAAHRRVLNALGARTTRQLSVITERL